MPNFETPPPDGEGSNGRLGSWKEIAGYLGAGVRSVQRWEETESLPVHRHAHDKRSTVYAYKTELDVWRRGRRDLIDAGGAEDRAQEGPEPLTISASKPVSGVRTWTTLAWITAASLSIF